MTKDIFNTVTIAWIFIAFVTFLFLLIFNVRAPYGRHTTDKWGKTIANNWGWFIMELPALLTMPLLALIGQSSFSNYKIIVISLWVFHYTNRTLIFPFKLNTKGKQIPVIIVISAIVFNGINGLINGYHLGNLRVEIEIQWFQWLGIAIFIIGYYINTQTDKRLIKLRKANQAEYSIPRGWLFDKISCPNHFGEIIEWFGFALFAWSLPALSFAIWTFCNLAPRALNHHEWYKEYFKNYPKTRKAFLPYIW